VAARVGVRAVHKGRVGLAIGALHLGPAPHQLPAARGGAGGDRAADLRRRPPPPWPPQARRDQVEQAIGADAVLRVSEVRPAALLRTVRTVDPSGAYAMAVVAVDPGPAGKRVLAVDATRLTTAAVWPGAAGLSAAAAARALRPDLGAPAPVNGAALTVTADAAVLTIRSAGTSLHLQATVAPLDGGPTRTYDLGALRPGAATYSADVGCAAGCRLVGLTDLPQRRGLGRLPPHAHLAGVRRLEEPRPVRADLAGHAGRAGAVGVERAVRRRRAARRAARRPGPAARCWTWPTRRCRCWSSPVATTSPWSRPATRRRCPASGTPGCWPTWST
jgi:hypothetical protein